MNAVKIIRMYNDVILPEYKTSGAVGMDICAYTKKDIILFSNQCIPIETGIKLQLPNDIEAQVRTRSGLAAKGVIVANSPGTIDPDYTGEIRVILTYITTFEHIPFVIKNGDRIAQLVFAPIVRVKFDEVETFVETERGERGFGSTGV